MSNSVLIRLGTDDYKKLVKGQKVTKTLMGGQMAGWQIHFRLKDVSPKEMQDGLTEAHGDIYPHHKSWE